MTISNPFNTQPTLATIALIVSILIIIKYGIFALLLLIAFYLIFTRLMMDVEIMFHPKHPYHKFIKFIRGCFALEDSVWLDNDLDSEFTSLTNYCKEKKIKLILFSEQLENFSRAYKDDESLKVFDRIAAMQKAKVLVILPAVKAPPAKPKPFSEYFKSEEDEKATNIGVIYEAPLPPKPPKWKMEFIKAITHYSKLCPNKAQMSYVSKDTEIKVRITDFLEKNKDSKINIFPLKEFQKSFEYIDRFKIKFVETHKKKKKAKELKKKDRKKQFENLGEAVVSTLPKKEEIKEELEEKIEEKIEEKTDKK